LAKLASDMAAGLFPSPHSFSPPFFLFDRREADSNPIAELGAHRRVSPSLPSSLFFLFPIQEKEEERQYEKRGESQPGDSLPLIFPFFLLLSRIIEPE